MSVVSITAEEELVTAEQAREWCRADSSDDAFLKGLIPTARGLAEAATGRTLCEKTLVYRADSFPTGRTINLEHPPLLSVTSIEYIDVNGDLQPLSDDKYTVDIYSSPGRIVLNQYESWPDTQSAPNALKITYQAGYTELPAELRDGIRFLIAHMFSHREPMTGKTNVKEIPENLLPFFMHHKVNW